MTVTCCVFLLFIPAFFFFTNTLVLFLSPLHGSSLLSTISTAQGSLCPEEGNSSQFLQLHIYDTQQITEKPHAVEQITYSITPGVQRKNNLPFVNDQYAVIKYVDSIKSMFALLDEGDISISAYDTAWVALIEEVDGLSGGGPQFPSCLRWIVNHQHPDGSWGEPTLFSAYDKLLNTLACVIALTAWNIHFDKCRKGMKFVEENMNKLGEEKTEHMTPGFEIVFPSLVELAKKFKIKVPTNSPIFNEIIARRDRKLTMIPKDLIHKIPTILLYTLEGMKDLEWGKLLKLQSEGGSFCFSPAATAFAFMQTKDPNCLAYLTNIVAKFNGGVPNIYPIDMYERIWMVDRLQRLGIARYFSSEIKDCVDYIHRHWEEKGIGFVKNCNLPDLDDTSMAFRILRTSGYHISPDVFSHFKEDGNFGCYPKQTTESVTVMLNLHRASHVLFPGEKIMEEAKTFSHKYLTEKQSANQLLDKWFIPKDLPGEVRYVLNVPWYASLPRLEARYYVEQYGGDDEIWIGKTLYRLTNVCNNKYLEMAKLDYNNCQTIHQLEWSHIQKWYADLKIDEGLDTKVLWSYYEAAASIFEPERHNERVSWAKTVVLINIITSFFARPQFTNADIKAFSNEFSNPQRHEKDRKPWHVIMNALHKTLKQISSETGVANGEHVYVRLHHAWATWLLSWQKEVDEASGEAELIVQTIIKISDRWSLEETLSHPQYRRMSSITNELFRQLSHKGDHAIGSQIESKMQELVQLVLCNSPNDLDPDLKQIFLLVAKTVYYRAYFDPKTINLHISKVLFEKVM
ncbi:ent-copalyl diphosphate synthase 1-like [Rutidosis leptorrhynchoides]|uniref:ent-copalyl diphosphate synthase 1-like n=1 Tax=Rutidosis leptorrhynchoides TaxID=125765 RepID=UPI003A995780